MERYGIRNSQKKNQKPQTKTHHNKTIKSREADRFKKILVPAIATLMAGFFILNTSTNGQSATNMSDTNGSGGTTNSSLQETSVIHDKSRATKESLKSSLNSNTDNSTSIDANSSSSGSSSTSVSVHSSISVSANSESNLSEKESKLKVNGKEVNLSKNGTYREDCRDDTSRSKTKIRVRGDGSTSVNVQGTEQCSG